MIQHSAGTAPASLYYLSPRLLCTIAPVYRTNSLLHQDSFFTQEIAPHCTLFSSAATSFLPRKEFDQPGLFGHRITCRRQLHLSNAAISNFEELAHKGFDDHLWKYKVVLHYFRTWELKGLFLNWWKILQEHCKFKTALTSRYKLKISFPFARNCGCFPFQPISLHN